MKTTTYICDTCKKSVSEKELIEISMSIKGITFNEKVTWKPSSSKTVEICKDCLKKKGFQFVEMTEENKQEIEKKNEKTLQDKIIDILEDLEVCFTDHDHGY